MDLGDRFTYYCVVDKAGEVMVEQKLLTSRQAMKQVFGGMPSSRVALETGAHSPWVSRLLTQLGHEVIVAHARNVRLIRTNIQFLRLLSNLGFAIDSIFFSSSEKKSERRGYLYGAILGAGGNRSHAISPQRIPARRPRNL